jgi:hypothetical protein
MKAHMFHRGARTVKGSYHEKSCMLRALSHCLIFRAILIPRLRLGYSPSWNTCATFSRSDHLRAREAQRGGSYGLVRGIFRRRQPRKRKTSPGARPWSYRDTFPLASKPQSLRPFLISKALGVSPAVAREESESNLVPNPILVRQPRCAISSRCRKWKLAKPESGL